MSVYIFFLIKHFFPLKRISNFFYQLQSKVILRLHNIFHFSAFLTVQFLREKKNLKKIYTSQYLRTWWLVSTFFGPRYIGDDFFFRAEWVEIISPIEIRIHHFLSGKNNNTLHKIDTSQTVYQKFLLFCTVKQLNVY
jgi:hypothetical protein